MRLKPPTPKPLIDSKTILYGGVAIYLIAITMPSLLLLVALLLSKSLPYLFRKNDYGDERRKNWKPWSMEEKRPEAWKPKNFSKYATVKESFWMNPRGMALMTSIITPKNNKIIAVVCLCHGFNDNSSYIKRLEYQRLVKKGIAIVTIEYEGHGRSDGLLSYIPSWTNLIDDASTFFQETIEKHFSGKKCFLLGESMGGAICYYTYKRNPKLWRGVVFVCPMLKISDKMLPSPWVIELARKILGPAGSYSPIGWLPIAPAKKAEEIAFHLPEKRYVVCNFPSYYGRKPRLATARELIIVTEYISKNYKNFDAPFIILHGTSDMVTSPDLSQSFYEDSISRDKDIKLYDGLWHNLTCGETDEDTEIVMNDMITWILARV